MNWKAFMSRYYWLAYLLIAAKEFIFYWQTDRLDMMNIFPVALLTYGFLLGIYELCSMADRRGLRWIFYLVYGIITIIFFADAAYSSYFGQYASVNQLYQIGSLTQIAGDGNVLGSSISPGCLLCLVDYPLILLFYKARKKGRPAFETRRQKLFSFCYYVSHISLYIVLAVSFWYYGFNPFNYREIQQINHIEIFTYHTNDILVNVVGKMQRKNIDESELIEEIEAARPKSSGSNYQGVAEGKNLILIQVESLNDFVIGAEYNGQEITPFFNDFLDEDSFYFNHFYSTTGVGNTSDAEFSTLNSLYANTERECYRLYVDNTFDGLPWMFREAGYESLAFHGYLKTFWNREEAYKNIGFQRFYSQDDFDITETEGFGLTDKEMFRQAVDILKEKEGPTFSFMITLTNHIPYELSDERASLVLKEEDEGTTFGNYLRTVRYTDEAIEELVTLLKENDMYDNTVIALYGDHQGLNKETYQVQQSMSNYLGREYDYDEMLNVPFIIHIPGLGEAKTITTVGGEVDTMPTLANLMGLTIDQPYVFGHDLLNTEEGFIAQISYIGLGSFITDDNNMIFAIGKDGTVKNGRVISLIDGSSKNLNEILCTAKSERAENLIALCKEALDYNLIANYVNH